VVTPGAGVAITPGLEGHSITFEAAESKVIALPISVES
jgi:hypothetical protein